jgi:outer membrane protein
MKFRLWLTTGVVGFFFTVSGSAQEGIVSVLPKIVQPSVSPVVSPAPDQPPVLTLEEARNIALKNHPRIAEATAEAGAAQALIAETRSGYFPTVTGSISTVGATPEARIASGLGLVNPDISTRFSTGIFVTQLISDFGRTGKLVESTRLNASAKTESVHSAEAETLRELYQAYYGVARAEALLKVAEETVKAREIVFEQVDTLAKNGLRSSLDVSFAALNVSDAKLLQVKARNEVAAAQVRLGNALGLGGSQLYQVEEPNDIPDLPPLENALRTAIANRPDLKRVRLDEQAAASFLESEKRLNRPTIGAIGDVNVVPYDSRKFQNGNAVAGVFVSIPIFNGHLFDARRREAEQRDAAAKERIREAENRILQDVRIAWLESDTALQQLRLAQQQLDQAVVALDLARYRYDLKLGSIVELSQAQLQQTAAAIRVAESRNDVNVKIAELKYQTGQLQ